MVKFSKELEAQLIPEWKEAFVNYWLLKKHVKKIKVLRKSRPHNHSLGFGVSFPSIISNLFHSLFPNHQDNKPTEKAKQELEKNVQENDDYDEESSNKNELIHLFSEEDQIKAFFVILDDELDKVNEFYKSKEEEFIERGEILKNQLRILLDIKRFSIKERKSYKLSFTGSLSRSYSSSTRNSDFSENGADFSAATAETSPQYDVADTRRQGKPKTAVKIVIPATNPTRTITAVTKMLWEDLVNNPKKDGSGDSINRKKIENAEKMIRGAFVELYRGLGLLKTYSSLNMVAFTKIIKKFDKIADQNSSSSFLQMVRRSHFISSDKVLRLMDEVESIFTKHFARDNRKRAMKFLRPQENKDSHMVTFLVGLSTGCFVTLFTAYLVLLQISEVLYSPNSATAYMETVYPVFSMFALLSLHLFLYGCNLSMWRGKRINYNFIFEFQPSKSLNHRDVFLICTSIMATVVAALVVHLILRVNGLYPGKVDAIPGFLLLVFISLLICPFNIFYRSTRYCFLRIIRNIVCSPLYKVMMVDFFMADQLTSQIPLLRHMESSACYFLAENFATHQFETCKSGKLYRQLAYIISFLPYYWRAMQCARRWFDEYDTNHLANMGKYVSAMVAAGARLTYATNDNHLWLSIVLVTSAVATMYQLYWDFVKDWGLLNPKSKNPWLRDDLILRRKGFYYISIALNLVLRVAWVETVLPFRVGILQSRLLEFLLASLEVIRRGHWNFYRAENEHLNNVGKFRAVKAVPLPFQETDSDD